MTDFPRLIAELNQIGLSNNSLAFLLRVSNSTIGNWAKGKSEPRYSLALELIAIHENNCKGHQAFNARSG